MTIPSAPLTLQQIQNEYGTSGIVASSTAAGLDPLPTAMLDFAGLSAFSYVSQYGGSWNATSSNSKPVGVQVRINTDGTFTITKTGIGTLNSFPDFSPQRWISPTTAAAGVYSSLWVRATVDYSLSVDGDLNSTSSADMSGPGLVGAHNGEGGVTVDGQETGSWVTLSSAAGATYPWWAAAGHANSACDAIVNFTIDISTSNGGPIVASATFYLEAFS